VKLLNVDLSTVTASADLILGLGDPLEVATDETRIEHGKS
jgi:hypothetical protein